MPWTTVSAACDGPTDRGWRNASDGSGLPILMGRVVVAGDDPGSLTIAADFESGYDFVKMFDLGGGMPTRVTVPEARHSEVMSKLAAEIARRRPSV